MKDSVLIKSFPNGIMLHLKEDVPFQEIIEELAFKFSEARSFFKNASMALSIEGREVSDTEEILILDTIKRNSDLNIVCLVGHDEETNKNFIKALQHMEKKLTRGDEGQFYRGTLKNNETLETENSIVIMGDVYPGSAIVSAKNIIVLGGLYGEAYAGANGQENAFVAALEMEPETLKIGDFKYKSTRQPKWGIRPKIQPKTAYVKNNRIVVEPLTKDLLSSF
ncbi:MAG: septum site-determining protein MinC [Roseburia sp.]|nr:septum site-determining protein MinC [Roseburia sp.]